MAVKKSELYSTLWKSCDELRGGMDASQYKDYVLVLLFVKYISDKYSNNPDALIEVPEGGSFNDMIALKGKTDIGDKMNKIIGRIAEANDLKGVIDVADFNDNTKLGNGKEMVDRLSNLVGLFQSSGLDFSKNRAQGDDILGDAYEYLMKNFASESGKSKGQFYTPAEVSRILAKVIGLNHETSVRATIYDPTCGSASLLLKANDETLKGITIYGQEKDNATAGLAKMNMILHGVETAEIKQGDTLSSPRFLDDNGGLKTFDYVVANPPFSTKSWSSGLDVNDDFYNRWNPTIGIPPEKNGDYAFLMHIIRSLKSTGKGACILPHGVLFRGNAEGKIRENILMRGYIKGIIGLPANLFFGTGIPACIIILDKEHAATRKGVFMIDAKNGFIKDGNKNRLREMDVRKIVDTWNAQAEVPKFARMVPMDEIKGNDYNLNIPRYIDSQDADDVQNIEAHLLGGVPNDDIDALAAYWEVCPSMRQELFTPARTGFSLLNVEKQDIRETVYGNADFVKQIELIARLFVSWKAEFHPRLSSLTPGFRPKALIAEMGSRLLEIFAQEEFINKYDVYECLMDYWAETMQDDCYQINDEGWRLNLYAPNPKRPDEKVCDLLPAEYVIRAYFQEKQDAIDSLTNELEQLIATRAEMLEEHAEGCLNADDYDDGKVNKQTVGKRIKATPKSAKKELKVLNEFLELYTQESTLKKSIKEQQEELQRLLMKKYGSLTESEIKHLVIDRKWMESIRSMIENEMQRISQSLTTRIVELAERYEETLTDLDREETALESKVIAHLARMGFKL